MPGFLAELKVLAQTIKAKHKDAYDAALKAVMAKLDAIEQNIKAGKAPWSATVKAAVISVLKTAAEEYANAVKDGKIAEAVEYQDSRGFIWRADAMLKDGALRKSAAIQRTLAAAAEAIGKAQIRLARAHAARSRRRERGKRRSRHRKARKVARGDPIALHDCKSAFQHPYRGLRVFLAVAVTAGAAGLAGALLPRKKNKRLARADFQRPDGFPVPAANPGTAEKVALGERLFNDPRLSSNGKVACATCHNPSLAFADGVARGKGVAGTPLGRHTPTLWNLAWGETYFWDGRTKSLEEQARIPLENPIEMNMKLEDATRVLAGDETLTAAFAAVFAGEGLTGENVLKALAAYERTLVSPRTRFDRWAAGDDAALDGARGRRLQDLHRQGRLYQLPRDVAVHRRRLS